MASEENSNHYGVYVVFTSETLDEDKVVDKLLSHMTQVNEQLDRKPDTLPHVLLPAFNDLDELLATKPSDYKLTNYNPQQTIKAPMAV